MQSPTITWRLRKIGGTWWPMPRAGSQPRWLAARTPVIGRAAAKPPGLKAARAGAAADGAPDGATASTSRAWLEASLA